MGQYQQWLSAQEVDRRLRAELETLETELFYLQDRITILEQVVPATENVIVQALSAYLQQPENQQQPAGKRTDTPPHSQEQVEPAPRAASPAEAPLPGGEAAREAVAPAPRPSSRADLSADMLAFFDQRSQTDPKLSALLQRERQRAAGVSSHPIDEETRRLNENIQRWFMRWHRQVTDGVPAEEVENE